MATEAQIAANRANAQKSTGPQTAEGKEKVAQNALKHGLFSQKNVVISENQVEYDMLEGEMLAELAPIGVMETMLATRIVSLMWRLKRAERMQNEAIDMQIRREINNHSHYLTKSLLTGEPNKYPDESYDDIALGYIAVRDFPEMRILERLAMYERRFELSLYKTMAEFKKLQKDRKAKGAKLELKTNRGQACPERSRRDARDTDARDTIGDSPMDSLRRIQNLEKQTQSRKNIEYRTKNIEFRNKGVPVEQSA